LLESTVPPMSETPPDTIRRPLRLERKWILLAAALAALLVLRAMLPVAVAGFAERTLRSSLGYDATIRDVDLNLLRGRIAVEGLELATARAGEPDGSPARQATTLAWERVAVDVTLRELLGGRIHITDVVIVAPQIRIPRQLDGRFDAIVPAAPVEPEEDTEDDEPLAIAIDRVVIRDAAVRVVDTADDAELLALTLGEVALDAIRVDGEDVLLGDVSLSGPTLRIVRHFALKPVRPAPPAQAPPAAEPEAPPEATPEPEAATGSAPDAAPESAPVVAQEPPPAPTPSAERRIDSIELEAASFTLATGDRSLDVRATFTAKDASLAAGDRFPIELGLEVEDGSLALAGDLSLAPFGFAGKMEWNDLPIPVLALTLRPDLADWIRSCRSTASMDVAIATEAKDSVPPGLHATGAATLTNVELADPERDELRVTWNELKLDLDELTVPIGGAPDAPVRIVLSGVELVEPDVAYRHPSDALERLFVGPDAEASPEEPEAAEIAADDASPPAQIRLRDAAIRDGKLLFEDRTIAPAFETAAREITATLRELSVSDAVTIESADLAMRLRGNARARGKGWMKPGESRFEIELDRVALPPLNGYAAGAGMKATAGALSSESTLVHEGSRWKVDNDLTLHGLKLDSKGSAGLREALGMPTDVMLTLLRDPLGNISLPLNLSFEPGGARTAFAASLVGAFRQAIVGAATIPLKGATSLLRLGLGGDRLDAIPFAPGFAEITPEGREGVGAVSGLLAARPELGVAFTGSAGKEDRDPLAVQILAERLEAGDDLPAVEGADPGFFQRRRIEGALRDRARGEAADLDEEDEALFDRWVAAVDVPEKRYRDLAALRAQRALGVLVREEGVDAERARVENTTRDDDPGVLIDLFTLD